MTRLYPLIAAVLLLLLGGGILFHIWHRQPLPATSTNHRYEQYEYGRGDAAKVIDLGFVPTSMYTSFLSECLLHDRILKKQLAAEGWTIRAHSYSIGIDMFPYADGRLDMMILGDIGAFTALQTLNMGLFALNSESEVTIIANRRLTPQDLKGKRIAYNTGTVTHFAVYRALAASHLAINDIITVPMDRALMENALLNNQVDAVAATEPFTTAILKDIPRTKVISTFPVAFYFASDLGFATRNATQLKTVLAALVRAAHWGRQDDAHLLQCLQWILEDQSKFIGKKSLAIDPNWIQELRKATIDNPSFPMLPLDINHVNSIQHQQFEFLKIARIIPATAQWEQLAIRFHGEFLPEIIQDGAKWQIDNFEYETGKTP